MSRTKPIAIQSLPRELQPIAAALDRNSNGKLELKDFASRQAFDAFVDSVAHTKALGRGLRALPPEAYVGRAVVIDPALGDSDHLAAWAKELTGPGDGNAARIIVVQPGSVLHAQAVEWKARGEVDAVVAKQHVSEALMAKRAAESSGKPKGRGVSFTFVPHRKQSPDIEGFMSAPDSAALGVLTASAGSLDAKRPKADKLSVTVRWYVEGFGHLWLEADNAGAYFKPSEARGLQLNYELARTRVHRNSGVATRYAKAGMRVPVAVRRLQEASAAELATAAKSGDMRVRARHADRALNAALRAGEQLELAWSAHQQRRPDFRRPSFGIDSRHYFLGRYPAIDKHIPKLVDAATITHYPSDTWAPHFEPREGELQWGIREEQFAWLDHHGITAEARPIFWPHEFVTPEFIAKKSFAELEAYVTRHATKMVEHWGERITHWEIANEMHDWANVHDLDSEQITSLIKAIADTVRRLQPHATLIVNNTNVFGEYAGLGYTAQGASERPIRTPYLFIRDLVRAGVDFDVIGLQFYHPERDLSDTVRLFERFEEFGKRIRIAEASAPSTNALEYATLHGKPFSEEQQAAWAETLFRVAGTRPSVDALFWYDISDMRAFVPSGGLLTEDGTPKKAFHRLLALRREWQQQEQRSATA